MSLFVCKSDYFVFNARAIPRSHTVNYARIERRTVQIFGYNALGFVISVGYVTDYLIYGGRLG